MDETVFMRRAIELARFGEGKTNPNPIVGAVIVKDGAIIGEGFHHKYGDLHAEREAIKDAFEKGNDVSGATIFVTLEPCCHTGKQPPCTQAILDAKIKRVVVGSRDPNPLVSGQGANFLRQNNVQVDEDFLRDECDALNPIFFHYIITKTPYIALKYAMTADGKIATKTSDSKWITGEHSRNFVQILRNRYSAIMVGIGTVLADDPLLTCRLGFENSSDKNIEEKYCSTPKLRIICDSHLRIPLESQIIKTAKDVPTLIACAYITNSIENNKSTLIEYNDVASSIENKKVQLEKMGVEVVNLAKNDKVDIEKLFDLLGERNIDSVLVEGGAELNYSVLQTGRVNHIYSFVGNKIFGGSAKSPIAGEGIEFVKDSFNLELKSMQKFDDDVLIEWECLK